jgi:hypothetical protein
MQVPRLDKDSEVLIRVYGLYHHARIMANPKTKHLAPGFEASQNQLKSKMEHRKGCEDKVQMEEATLVHMDQEMDAGIKDFERDILKEVRDNRKHQVFLKYFPEGLRAVTAAKYDVEALKVEQILALLEKEAAGKLKKEHFSALKDKLSGYKTAISNYKTAQDNNSNASAAEQAQKLEWKISCKKQEAELLLIFSGDQKMVDSFFKKIARSKKKKEDEGSEGGKLSVS